MEYMWQPRLLLRKPPVECQQTWRARDDAEIFAYRHPTNRQNLNESQEIAQEKQPPLTAQTKPPQVLQTSKVPTSETHDGQPVRIGCSVRHRHGVDAVSFGEPAPRCRRLAQQRAAGLLEVPRPKSRIRKSNADDPSEARLFDLRERSCRGAGGGEQTGTVSAS